MPLRLVSRSALRWNVRVKVVAQRLPPGHAGPAREHQRRRAARQQPVCAHHAARCRAGRRQLLRPNRQPGPPNRRRVQRCGERVQRGPAVRQCVGSYQPAGHAAAQRRRPRQRRRHRAAAKGVLGRAAGDGLAPTPRVRARARGGGAAAAARACRACPARPGMSVPVVEGSPLEGTPISRAPSSCEVKPPPAIPRLKNSPRHRHRPRVAAAARRARRRARAAVAAAGAVPVPVMVNS
jgi:hypothetical protein